MDYVVRLEQGRGPNPSARVLESLAGALRLDAAERVHLFRTAGVAPEPPLRPPHRVGRRVEYMLHRMPDVAAVGDRRSLRPRRVHPARGRAAR
ncbi:helix-turn-helix domain-containing protein [Actinopolyspora erythraea]|uniref:helix-turn-helix domain-containing protein n=1 Tax=Actinopolyspora erythraea TaxID=414996 RepID=UPI000A773487